MTVSHPISSRNRYYSCFQNYYNCHSYMALAPSYYTDIKLKANHWQLRDMLQINQLNGNAYFSFEDKIKYINLDQPVNEHGLVQLHVELQLDFQPRCFKQSNGGMMVFGGLKSTNEKRFIKNIDHARPSRIRTQTRTHDPTLLADSDHDNSNSMDYEEHDELEHDCSSDATSNDAAAESSYLISSATGGIEISVGSNGNSSTPSNKNTGNKYSEDVPVFPCAEVLSSFASYSSRSPTGLLLFHNPVLGNTETVVLGDMINNSVSIYPKHWTGINTSGYEANGQYVSYVCNNDLNLYVVDISGSEITLDRNIQCEIGTSLNNAELNPRSNKLLAVTGDLLLIFLVDPSSDKSCISTIKTSCDSGFGLSFDPSGYLLAATYQDGTCLIYDIRNIPRRNLTILGSNPLHTFKLTRAGHQLGAFRSCKFLDTGRDNLLVVSEHVGRVHVIDIKKASNFDTNSNLHDNISSSFSCNGWSRQKLDSDYQVIVLPFAMDQYGQWIKKRKQAQTASNEHYKVQVYTDNDSDSDPDTDFIQFPTPLVYDYEFLTNLNPKLFKDFNFQPSNEKMNRRPRIPIPDINVPNWNILEMDRMSFDYYNLNRSTSNSNYINNSNDTTMIQPPITTTANHVNGEMELAGVNWYGEKLAIACDGGGLLTWDMNIQRRENSGNYSYV